MLTGEVPPAGAAGQALQSAVLNCGNEFEESSSVSCRGSTLENYRTSTSNVSIDIISTMRQLFTYLRSSLVPRPMFSQQRMDYITATRKVAVM